MKKNKISKKNNGGKKRLIKKSFKPKSKKIKKSVKKNTFKKSLNIKVTTPRILSKSKKIKINTPTSKVFTKESRKGKTSLLPKIKVVGVGGAGGNVLSRMFEYFPKGVDLIAINTDAQDLEYCSAKKKIIIGKQVTKGIGAGMNPDLGRQAAEESREEIISALNGADMVFLASGFGGGTGSGAAPVIAEIAQEMGILTVAVVTRPFSFEGAQRAQIAQDAILKIKDRVDSYITISNDKIFSIIDKETSLHKAFEAIDEVLKNAVLGVTELIVSPGVINVDFADIKSIIQNSGVSIIGVGVASGKERAVNTVTQALNSPLLESAVDGAKGVLFSVSGHKDMKMSEINEIARLISENVDPTAKIIFGTYYDRKLAKGQIKVTLIATGFGSSYGRNYSLFSEFDSFGKTAAIFGNEKETDKTKPAKEQVTEEKKADNIQTEIFNEDEAWDVPAFMRKKGKRK